jgi:hypothetical protein
MLKQLIIAATALALTSCGNGPRPNAEPGIVYQQVKVAVPVGCVVDAPAAVMALKQRISDAQWAELAPGAKAEAVKAQAGARLNYEDALRAATSGCEAVPQ